MRILVVDSQFQLRWVIAGWLSAFLESAAIDSAASGEEALAEIERRRPNLVLAAHPMAEMDGIELARRVKAGPNPPMVVVMTDTTDREFEARCAAAGADFCLEKRHLQARLVAFLQKHFPIRLAQGDSA